jgi:uncharacterized protein YndB with AHSA1/START domain
MKTAIKNELLLTRIFDAPLESVWKAWTDPNEVKKWWGPKDFTAPHIAIDFRVGGEYLYCMHGAGLDGVVKDYWNTGKFLKIVPMKKITMSMSFADRQGHSVPASYYGMPGVWAAELMLMATFEEAKGGKTKLTVRQTGIPNEMIEPTNMGWNESFDKFTEVVASLARTSGERRKHKLAA